MILKFAHQVLNSRVRIVGGRETASNDSGGDLAMLTIGNMLSQTPSYDDSFNKIGGRPKIVVELPTVRGPAEPSGSSVRGW